MTDKPHILFVCGRNQWRSPTAARIYADDPRIEVRAAGVSGKSPHQISNQDMEWADLVLAMERRHQGWIRATFRDLPDAPRVECLEIPDEFERMDPELIDLIRERTEYHLKHRFGL